MYNRAALYIATTVVDDMLFYNVTTLTGFIVKQEHEVIFVCIHCEIAKCPKIKYLAITTSSSMFFIGKSSIILHLSFDTKRSTNKQAHAHEVLLHKIYEI